MCYTSLKTPALIVHACFPRAHLARVIPLTSLHHACLAYMQFLGGWASDGDDASRANNLPLIIDHIIGGLSIHADRITEKDLLDN